jgi:hypothetical protein
MNRRSRQVQFLKPNGIERRASRTGDAQNFWAFSVALALIFAGGAQLAYQPGGVQSYSEMEKTELRQGIVQAFESSAEVPVRKPASEETETTYILEPIQEASLEENRIAGERFKHLSPVHFSLKKSN